MILVNGTESDSVPASDRGLQYGDGLFETLPLIDGRPLCLERHLRRLIDGCKRLRIPPPERDQLLAGIQRVGADVELGVLKIIVTRGNAGRGYRPPASSVPTSIISSHPWPAYSPELEEIGVAVRTCSTRLGLNPTLAGLKHLNRLEQVMARSEWEDEGIHEGLMLDAEGLLISGIMSNLFILRAGVLITPDLTRAGVNGVMRSLVMEAADEAGICSKVVPVSTSMLERADELFLCNSLIGIWPVRELDGARYTVGPVTHRLRAILSNWGDLLATRR